MDTLERWICSCPGKTMSWWFTLLWDRCQAGFSGMNNGMVTHPTSWTNLLGDVNSWGYRALDPQPFCSWMIWNIATKQPAWKISSNQPPKPMMSIPKVPASNMATVFSTARCKHLQAGTAPCLWAKPCVLSTWLKVLRFWGRWISQGCASLLAILTRILFLLIADIIVA